MRRLVLKTLRFSASLFNYEITLNNTKNPNPIRLWNTNSEFNKLLREIGKRTAMGRQKLFILYQFAKLAEGNIAEIGVYKGGSSYLMSKASPQNIVYSFDTFEGMPETDPVHDIHKKGEFADFAPDTIDWLKKNLNIKICKGFFPADTGHIVEDKTFSLVHIDVDIYKSVQDCLEFFYPRIKSGGIILSDDYGATTTPGAKTAWDKFFVGKPEKTVYIPTGQCFIIKK